MKTTKHSLARMSQRGLPKKLIDIVYKFGKEKGDKIILDKKMVMRQLQELDMMRKELLRVMDKGGITIVLDGETLITAYNTSSYRRR